MHTPFAVGSHVQVQKQRLHWATQIPFLVHVQLQSPSARLRQRFWSVAQAAGSRHSQWILKPSAHVSKRIVHRGTAHHAGAWWEGAWAAPG